MTRTEFEKERKRLTKEMCDELWKLFLKHPVPRGVLDGGPPKEEEDKIKRKYKEQIGKLELTVED